ncbi:MAG: TonB-dependent receptor, partial [Bradyrhizobium sp.]
GANGLAPAFADELPEIVVTADRVEEPIGQTGASITVIHAAEVEKLGTKGFADVLQGVAGLDVYEAGGVGGVTQVRLRAAQPGETLVLIDGIRVGNTTSTDGSVDFGNLSTVDIDRIEILRGPQSALYGSDAMGGVINIITRKGGKTPRRNVTVEAGSYGTLSTRASMSGSDGAWTYSLGINALHSDGFARYGYRIDHPIIIGDGVTPLPPLPADDPTDKGGVSGRFSYKVSDDVSVDFGFSVFGNAIRFDNPGAFLASDVFNPFNHSRVFVGDAFVRANIDSFGGALKSQITAFGNVTRNDVWETEACYDGNLAYPFPALFNCRNSYLGTRYGAEYQGDLKIGPFGSLVFGAKTETETASENEDPNPNDGSFTPISAQQTTNSLYAEHRLTLFQRLDLTFGGRIDAVENGPSFDTWRATAAYHIDETGTKLRASAGSADKAATLYQRFSIYGTSDLLPEQSVGFDAGIDQKLFNDRLTASATLFSTKYHDLVAYGDVSSCSPAQIMGFLGCYYNVGRAEMQGVELSADATLVPGVLRAKATYTYTDARDLGVAGTGDLDAGLQLYHIPRNKGSLSLIYDGVANLEIEPRLSLVGQRIDEYFNETTFTSQNVNLGSYAKLDVLANYKVNDNLSMFARIENLTDTRYEEVYNYGTAGRSYYAGISYSW